ncbi:MAG: hypothetical protein EAZ64_01045 [Sphingobacteriales bacterium]|nr:MAG: hypothetical protein EAZ64_01045 [Sphingobacteriales bacterium]
MENTPEVKAFIRENSHLFWYTPKDKLEEIDHEFLVEHILNYGDMDAVRKLIEVLGMEHTAEVFFKHIAKSDRHRGNYFPLYLDYFEKLFTKYVPQCSK